MVNQARYKEPHLLDSFHFVLLEKDGDSHSWVNLAQVFKVEVEDTGTGFKLVFYSPSIATTPAGAMVFNTTKTKEYATTAELIEKAKEVFWNFPGNEGFDIP